MHNITLIISPGYEIGVAFSEPENLASLQIDHSIIESFGGKGRSCITARVYPKLAIGNEAELSAFNNGTLDVTISRLKAWSMKKAHLVSSNYIRSHRVPLMRSQQFN
ncbi:hypothetical protein SLA2020_007060 [Shorea laevis]